MRLLFNYYPVLAFVMEFVIFSNRYSIIKKFLINVTGMLKKSIIFVSLESNMNDILSLSNLIKK